MKKRCREIIWHDLRWKFGTYDWLGLILIIGTAIFVTPVLMMLFWDVGVIISLLIGRQLDNPDAIMAGGMLTTIFLAGMSCVIAEFREYLKCVKIRANRKENY